MKISLTHPLIDLNTQAKLLNRRANRMLEDGIQPVRTFRRLRELREEIARREVRAEREFKMSFRR